MAIRRSFRLAVDAVGAKHSGAASVLQEVIREVLAAGRFDVVTVFCSPLRFRRFEFPVDGRLRIREVPEAENGWLSRLRWLEYQLSDFAREERADVLLALQNGGVPPAGIPTCTFVQQSLPFSDEAIAGANARERLWLWGITRAMERGCRRSDVVVVQTETMKRSVSRRFRISIARIRVCPSLPTPLWPTESAGEEVHRAWKGVPPDGRFLYVGNSSWYKNLKVLYRGFAGARKRRSDLGLVLTIPESDQSQSAVVGVAHVGLVSRTELAQLYRQATALIIPSLSETVCLPLVEAMAMSLPILVADRPYARELCGDAAVFFDPHDAEELAAKVLALAGSVGARRDHAEKSLKRSAALAEWSREAPLTGVLEEMARER